MSRYDRDSLYAYEQPDDAYPSSRLYVSRHRRRSYQEQVPAGDYEWRNSDSDRFRYRNSHNDGERQYSNNENPDEELFIPTGGRSPSFHSRHSAHRTRMHESRASHNPPRSISSGYRAGSELSLPSISLPRRSREDHESSRRVLSSRSRKAVEEEMHPLRHYEPSHRYRSHSARHPSPPPPPILEGLRMSEHELRKVGHFELPPAGSRVAELRPSYHRSSSGRMLNGSDRLRDHYNSSGSDVPGPRHDREQQYSRPIYDSNFDALLDPFDRNPSSSVYLRPTSSNTDEVYPDDSISTIGDRSRRRDLHRGERYESADRTHDRPALYEASSGPCRRHTPLSQRLPGFVERPRYSNPYSGYS